MDVMTDRVVAPVQQRTSVRAHELLNVFAAYQTKIKVLSLDCFDTILWRRTAAPKDVFLDLQSQPTFQRLGISHVMRVKGETHARRLEKIHRGKTQPNLQDIHRACLLNLSDEEMSALGEEELAAEIEACYGFPPMFDLIRAAHAQGIKVVIISNTYFNKTQLTRLLKSKLPADVMQAITDIFCSCDLGKGKTEGLFEEVLYKLKVKPAAMLHLGDNSIADFESAKVYGINAYHFVQQDTHVAEIMRMQAIAASFFDPAIRNERALYNPFAGMISIGVKDEKPQELIGYASLGPVLYAFAQFVLAEVAALKQAGKRPKVLFVMRDGYLPALVCAALQNASFGTCVEVGRFAAVASSFRTAHDVIDYVARASTSLRFDDLCRQLLLPETMVASILAEVNRSKDPIHEFAGCVSRSNVMKTIIEKSAAFRERLKKYLCKKANVSAGDTVVLVDLGYSGTAQTAMAPGLQEEMNIEIVGLYLLAFKTYDRVQVRKGLLDERFCSSNALKMLVTYISLFEQMCSSGEKSAIDYDEESNPIYSDVALKLQQIQKIKTVQAECLRFAKDTEKFLALSSLQLNADILRDVAAMSLARFIYFPTQAEIQFFADFAHDVNFGASEVLPMLNVNLGLKQLQHRSWLFALKEDVKNMRMNYPAELRAANLELSFALMAQHRFDLEFAATDLSLRRQQVNLILQENNRMAQVPMEAMLTHDGYYAIHVPVAPKSEVGIQFGAYYQWIELESANIIELKHLYSYNETSHTHDASAALAGVHMVSHGGGLYECTSNTSLLVFMPSQQVVNNQFVLRVVFRPIVVR